MKKLGEFVYYPTNEYRIIKLCVIHTKLTESGTELRCVDVTPMENETTARAVVIITPDVDVFDNPTDAFKRLCEMINDKGNQIKRDVKTKWNNRCPEGNEIE